MRRAKGFKEKYFFYFIISCRRPPRKRVGALRGDGTPGRRGGEDPPFPFPPFVVQSKRRPLRLPPPLRRRTSGGSRPISPSWRAEAALRQKLISPLEHQKRPRCGPVLQRGFACICFPLRGTGKQIKESTSVCTGRCKPPMWLADMIRIPRGATKKKTPVGGSSFLVLQRGFEPRTPCLKGRCSAC